MTEQIFKDVNYLFEGTPDYWSSGAWTFFSLVLASNEVGRFKDPAEGTAEGYGEG